MFKNVLFYIWGVVISGSWNQPKWLNNLENEGLECIKNFVLYSSSLKGLASFYEVSYPTVRNRLNIVIKKVETTQENDVDSIVNFIRKLAVEDKLDLDDAKHLLKLHKNEKGEWTFEFIMSFLPVLIYAAILALQYFLSRTGNKIIGLLYCL